MSLIGMNIAVLGGGIGGLAAALAFAQRGAQVTVLEQAEAIKEVGAGLQISPNGYRVLEALGVARELAQRSVRGKAVELVDYKAGRRVARLDLTRLGDSQPYHFVHRADLVDLLAQAVRASGVRIRLLQQAKCIEPGPRPKVRLTNGSEMRADLVIGADGLHSVVRPVLNGAAEPFFTGQVAWRTVVPNVVQQPNVARVHMGPGQHIVTYPLRDGNSLNVVAVQEREEWAAEGWSHRDKPVNLRVAFSSFGGDIPAILKAAEQVNVWGLFRHPVAKTWHGENVAILGDAAHPTLPFMAQGAVMAIEDAWVLVDSLARSEDIQTGLSLYQARREERVSNVVEAASQNATHYHLSRPAARLAAHTALGLASTIAPSKLLARFDWIYRHDVTREEV